MNIISGKTVAVIGYGSQGHAHAQNLRDSGMKVVIGLYEGSKSAETAKADGFNVYPAAEAVKQADIVMMLVNDEKMADIYKKDVAPNLRQAMTLCFAHGFNIISTDHTPDFVNVVMIAPKGPVNGQKPVQKEKAYLPDCGIHDAKERKDTHSHMPGIGGRGAEFWKHVKRNGDRPVREQAFYAAELRAMKPVSIRCEAGYQPKALIRVLCMK